MTVAAAGRPMPMRRILLAAALGGAAGAPWEGEAWPSLDSIANARRLYRTGETGVSECWLATTLLDACPDEWPAPEYTMAHDEGETWYPAEAHTLTYCRTARSSCERSRPRRRRRPMFLSICSRARARIAPPSSRRATRRSSSTASS